MCGVHAGTMPTHRPHASVALKRRALSIQAMEDGDMTCHVAAKTGRCTGPSDVGMTNRCVQSMDNDKEGKWALIMEKPLLMNEGGHGLAAGPALPYK